MVEQATSPVIQKQEMLDFPNAIRAIVEGKKVTRLAWNDKDIYGLHKDTFLMLHKKDGILYIWTVSTGDLLAEDWILVE